MKDYKVLIETLRKRVEVYGLTGDENSKIAKLLAESADAIEALQEKLNRAISFWDDCVSDEEIASLRELNSCFPDVYDPAWQKAHKEMGFLSSLADVYEMLGVYDEKEQEESECREEN